MGTYYRWLIHSIFIEGRTTLWCYNQMAENGDSPTSTFSPETVAEDLDCALRQLEIDHPAKQER